MIDHVVSTVRQALPEFPVVLATSAEPSDDPLAAYAKGLKIPVVRGSLDNVVERFGRCLKEFPCTFFLRICADSPRLDGALLRQIVGSGSDRVDLVTTLHPRTFPKGQNAELVRSETFETMTRQPLSRDEQEHATLYFYRHPEQFRILNVESGNRALADLSLAVDDLADLRRLEELSDAEWEKLRAPALLAS